MNAANLPVEDVAGDPLASASHEEVAACARLLAVSVAHHRAKFGVVPIATTDAQLGDPKHGSSAATLQRKALGTLKEALDPVLLRQVDNEQTPDAAGQVPPDETRHHMRISVTAPVWVSDLDGGPRRSATLRNVSWGGAAALCDDMPVAVGERVCLILPEARERNIEIDATLLRESMVECGREYGLRFDSLDQEDEERLPQVLRLLVTAPDHERRRSESRLVQRLEVGYAEEFQAMLEDISTGGMMLTVPEPLEIDQSLAISLSSADTPFALNLRARISALVDELAILRPRQRGVTDRGDVVEAATGA